MGGGNLGYVERGKCSLEKAKLQGEGVERINQGYMCRRSKEKRDYRRSLSARSSAAAVEMLQ